MNIKMRQDAVVSGLGLGKEKRLDRYILDWADVVMLMGRVDLIE